MGNTAVADEAARSESLMQFEATVAGGIVAWGSRGHVEFGREVLDLCPAHCFASIRHKEIIEACARLLHKGQTPDVPTVALELKSAKALCTQAELAAIVLDADRSTTRNGIREAARAVKTEHAKHEARQKLEKALQLCQSNLPLDVIGEAIQDAAAVVAGQSSDRRQPRHPLDFDPLQFSASRFEPFPPSFAWLLKNSFLLDDLGVIVGPPGTGKSTLALHLLAALASGARALDTWDTGEPLPSLYISAEDPELVLHRRTHHILCSMGMEEPRLREVAARMFIVPARGDVALFRDGAKTRAEAFIRSHLEATKARVLVLDTLSRFSGIEENDNASMTAFCSMLETIAKDYRCNVILLHHSNKAAGDCLEDEHALSQALSQTAMRGASALSGCARWVLTMAMLGRKLAENIIGPGSRGRPPGSYIAIRVAKKNAGAPEPRYFFGRVEHGLLQRIDPVSKEASDEEDARMLAEEVQKRLDNSAPQLSATKGGQTAFGWGIPKSKRISKKAVQMGLLDLSPKGSGSVLVPTVPGGSSEGRTDWMLNYDD